MPLTYGDLLALRIAADKAKTDQQSHVTVRLTPDQIYELEEAWEQMKARSEEQADA